MTGGILQAVLSTSTYPTLCDGAGTGSPFSFSKPPPDRVFFTDRDLGHLIPDVLAANLAHTLPRVFTFLDTHQPPFIARVYRASEADFERGRPGNVDLWLSYADWARLRRRS